MSAPSQGLPRWLPKWANKREKRPIYLAGVVTLCLFVYFLIPAPNQSLGWTGTFSPSKRFDVQGKHGAVASDSELCSQLGVNVLRSGGNAADAAIQVALCVGSMEPQSSGIGGGGFITLRYPNGTAFVIDCRETAPEGSHKHMFDDDPVMAKLGGLASGVPGELAGLNKLHEMASQLSWSELVLPVAELNERGFEKGESLVKMIEVYENTVGLEMLDELLEKSDFCWLFSHVERCRSPENPVDFIRRPKLAATLRKIAKHGADFFYHGEIAEHLVNLTQANGGILSLSDFANYKALVKPALIGTFRNLEVITAPAPASGPAMLMGLNVMDELLASPGMPAHLAEQDPIINQQIVETMKWMAAARSELGDPDFISNPKIADMLEVDWTANVVSQINTSHTLGSWRDYHPSYEMNNPKGTTHFSVVDKHGMAVSMTSTVNLPFGNFLSCPHTGIIMNSEMDDFSVPHNNNSFELAPSIYNFVEPGKRPLSSSVPSILVDKSTGNVELVIGSAGGSRILTSVFLGIVRVVGLGLTGLEAVSFPRYHHQLIPETLMIESGFSSKRIDAWESRGHIIEPRIPASTMNLIHNQNGIYHALGDYYRKRSFGAAY